MSEPTPVRPTQATIAAVLVMAGSVLVVLMAFGEVAELRSLDTRESIEEYLSKPPGDSLGLGLQGALSALRVVSMVAAACAAATAVLGFYVLQRDKRARLALSVLALPLFLAGLVSGGLASAVVAAAIVMLWFQPTRDWFDGRVPAVPERVPPARPGPDPFGPGPGRDSLLDLPPPTAPPLHPTPYASQQAPRATTAHRSAQERPAAVAWACGITWGCCAAVVLLFAAALLRLVVEPDTLLEEVRRQNPDLGVSNSELTQLLVAGFVACIVWSLVAAGLAALVWGRRRWAAIALGVSAAAACLTLLPVVACVATVVLLMRPDARQWIAGPLARDVMN